MKNRLLFLIIFIILFILTSCSFIPSRLKFLETKSDKEIAESRVMEILEALENKDNEALKSMLSEEALSEAEDIDEGIKSFIDCYQGTHIKYEEGHSTGGSLKYGQRAEYYINSSVDVTTDVDIYRILFLDYTVCADNPKKVGLYRIQIVRIKDIVKDGFGWRKEAGIYAIN